MSDVKLPKYMILATQNNIYDIAQIANVRMRVHCALVAGTLPGKVDPKQSSWFVIRLPYPIYSPLDPLYLPLSPLYTLTIIIHNDIYSYH